MHSRRSSVIISPFAVCACALLALLVSGCDPAALTTEYTVVYSAKGPRKGMSITIATPTGTEQHQVSEGYVSLPYTFRSGQSAYISVQNLSNRGEVTAFIRYSKSGSKTSEKLESTSSGAGAIATVSWRVGDEKAKGGF